MLSSPDLAVALQRDRNRAIAASTVARLAATARACCAAPVNAFARIVRFVRRQPAAC